MAASATAGATARDHRTSGPERAGSPGPVVSYRSRRSRVAHVVLVGAGWAVFGWLWWRVLGRPGAQDAVRSSLALVAALTALTAVVTGLWIAHNLALARRRAGRRSATPPLVAPERDRLGRRLVVDPGIDDARLVTVTVDGTTKRLSAEGSRHA